MLMMANVRSTIRFCLASTLCANSKLLRLGSRAPQASVLLFRDVTDRKLTCTNFKHLFNTRCASSMLILVSDPSMSVCKLAIETMESNKDVWGKRSARMLRAASFLHLAAIMGKVSKGTRYRSARSKSP